MVMSNPIIPAEEYTEGAKYEILQQFTEKWNRYFE